MDYDRSRGTHCCHEGKTKMAEKVVRPMNDSNPMLMLLLLPHHYKSPNELKPMLLPPTTGGKTHKQTWHYALTAHLLHLALHRLPHICTSQMRLLLQQ